MFFIVVRKYILDQTNAITNNIIDSKFIDKYGTSISSFIRYMNIVDTATIIR